MVAFLGNVFMGFSSSLTEIGSENVFNIELSIMKKKNIIKTNRVIGTPMTKEKYYSYRDWVPMFPSENGSQEGFLIEDFSLFGLTNHPNHNVGVSWLSKCAFESKYRGYRNNGEFTFGQAVDEGVKQGMVIRRESWSPDEYVFMSISNFLTSKAIQKSKALPQTVKNIFKRKEFGLDHGTSAYSLFKVDKSHELKAYSPSNDDIMSNDWSIRS